MSSLLTILGLYNYNDTIFDDMYLPEGLDKDYLIKNLISELAEVEILYSNPDYMKYMITAWSLKEAPTWERIYKTSQLEYNPLYNVDATEYTKETRDLKGTEVGTNTGSATGTSNNTHKVAGYNDNNLTQSDKDEGDSSTSSTMNSNINRTDKGDIVTEQRRFGNIGVTMSQQLVRAELDLIPELNVYNYIIESFKNRFCLLVY